MALHRGQAPAGDFGARRRDQVFGERFPAPFGRPQLLNPALPLPQQAIRRPADIGVATHDLAAGHAFKQVGVASLIAGRELEIGRHGRLQIG